jgi:hypothetical protein
VAADLLTKIRTEMDERLAALHPLLDEYARLTAAAGAFAEIKAGALPVEEFAASFADFGAVAGVVADAEAEAEEEAAAAGDDVPLAAAAHEKHPPAPTLSEEHSSAFSPSVAAPAALPGVPARDGVRRRGVWAAGAFGPAMSLRTTPPIQPIRPASSRVKKAERPSEERAAFARRAAAHERAVFERYAAESGGRRADSSFDPEPLPPRAPLSPTAVRKAILAALEHGSHTTTELIVVTALSPPDIRRNLRLLSERGDIAKVRRDGDNRAAYALRSAPARV